LPPDCSLQIFHLLLEAEVAQHQRHTSSLAIRPALDLALVHPEDDLVNVSPEMLLA
jgi:hypothetical protein